MGYSPPHASNRFLKTRSTCARLRQMEDFIQKKPAPPPKEVSTGEVLRILERSHLTEGDIARLRLLIPEDTLDIHKEILLQHAIVKEMQHKILDRDNKIHEEASAREISAVITGFTSYLSLYLKSITKIDEVKQAQEIETAIIDSVKDMPIDTQDKYFAKLKKRLKI